MNKGKNSKVNFFNLWLNHKVEKLREIERLCSAIMRVLNIAEKPSSDVAWCDVEGLTDNCDIPYRKPPELKWDDNSQSWKVWNDNSQSFEEIIMPNWKERLKQIDWGEVFDKQKRGEKTVYGGFRHWHSLHREYGTFMRYVFVPEDDGKADDTHKYPLIRSWYHESLDSFQSIRDDCNLLSKLLKAGDYDEQDFRNIEDTVIDCIEGAFMLIGLYEEKHGIAQKLRDLEALEKARRVKGGTAKKENAAILEAAKKFILENPKLLDRHNTDIARNFKKTYKSSNPLVITADKMEYEIYCDGKKVCSTSATGITGKYHDKSISYTTFIARYISKAKSMIKPPISKYS